MASRSSDKKLSTTGIRFIANNPHILIVEARFYDDIADELVRGAVTAIEGSG